MIEPEQTHVLICRAGFEDALRSEVSRNFPPGPIRKRVGGGGFPVSARSAPASTIAAPDAHANDCTEVAGACLGTGWIGLPVRHPFPRTSFAFERQRLPFAWRISAPLASRSDAEVADAIVSRWSGELSELASQRLPWTLHAFSPDPDAGGSLTGSAQRLGRAVGTRLSERYAPLSETRQDPETAARCTEAERGKMRVLQACRISGGVWASLAALSDLSDSYPGGVHRMQDDPLAPSRSYLKIEEALDVMGVQPMAGERVVDLGAAPGGWTWAFVKRGCWVTAVDRGDLKLKALGDWGGEVTHLREDGLRFRPRGAVDWLVSDMLIAPGVALGVLRKWHEAGWTRRYIVNLKLPQQQPDAALVPIRAALDALPGLSYRLRQLYHDRREVTLLGERVPAASSTAGRRSVSTRHRHKPRRPRKR